MTPEERARRCAEAMWSRDHASKWFDMELVSCGPGTAQMRLTVAERHCNGHGICHGGVIFSLADSAFAYACNSHNRNAVAQHNTITYIAPGRLGAQLTASAQEVSLAGRNGIYDIRVTDETGATIAEFRGCSRVVAGEHFAEGGDA